MLAQNPGSTGTLNLGTDQIVGTLNAAAVTGGSGNATVNFSYSGGSHTFAPRLTGTMTVNKFSSSGTTILTGSSSFVGATNVLAGTLKLGGSGSITSSTSVALAAGGVLDTTALASGTFTMLASQKFVFTLDATGNGSAGLLDASALDITSAVVEFAVAGALDDANYVIADYTSLTGTSFATVTNLPAGYAIDYHHNGTQIALIQTVPEPSALAALLGGLAVTGLRRRRN
jgi:autotransporter-associated beta strand protein